MKKLEYYLSLNYHKTVTQDDEGDYIVEVQELPGCVADGRSPDEAFENLREAMTSWLASRMEAGLEIAEPRVDEGYSGKILLRMAKSLHRRLAAQSAVEGVSLNQYLVTLLADASARVEFPVARKAEERPVLAAEGAMYGLRSMGLATVCIGGHGLFRRTASQPNWNPEPSDSWAGVVDMADEGWAQRYNNMLLSPTINNRPLPSRRKSEA